MCIVRYRKIPGPAIFSGRHSQVVAAASYAGPGGAGAFFCKRRGADGTGTDFAPVPGISDGAADPKPGVPAADCGRKITNGNVFAGSFPPLLFLQHNQSFVSHRKFINHLTNLHGLHIIMRSDDKTKYSATKASRDSVSRQPAEEGSFERN